MLPNTGHTAFNTNCWKVWKDGVNMFVSGVKEAHKNISGQSRESKTAGRLVCRGSKWKVNKWLISRTHMQRLSDVLVWENPLGFFFFPRPTFEKFFIITTVTQTATGGFIFCILYTFFARCVYIHSWCVSRRPLPTCRNLKKKKKNLLTWLIDVIPAANFRFFSPSGRRRRKEFWLCAAGSCFPRPRWWWMYWGV